MSIFSDQNNGYNKQEVDKYISLLRQDYETRLSEQKDRIFSLKNELENAERGDTVGELVSVVERARQIENSSKSIYELEIKKINLIYKRLDTIISAIMTDNGDMDNIKHQLDSLKRTIDSTLSTQYTIPDSTDPVRRLLARMTSQIQSKPQPIESKAESIKPDESQPKKANISSAPKVTRRPKASLSTFDNFIQDDIGDDAFEKVLFSGKKPKNVITDNLAYPTPNESGFDLKEAVNPKDDLDEIMKAFDFFNNDDE